jgi:hypothetical protein
MGYTPYGNLQWKRRNETAAITRDEWITATGKIRVASILISSLADNIISLIEEGDAPDVDVVKLKLWVTAKAPVILNAPQGEFLFDLAAGRSLMFTSSATTGLCVQVLYSEKPALG